jgi:hypothetical protein
MTGASLSARIHKWLALLMAIQILFWFASGLFFALFPISLNGGRTPDGGRPA